MGTYPSYEVYVPNDVAADAGKSVAKVAADNKAPFIAGAAAAAAAGAALLLMKRK